MQNVQLKFTNSFYEKDSELNSKNRSGYSKILKEIRDSLRFLECYKVVNDETDVKRYIPCKKNLNVSIGTKKFDKRKFDNDSIYLCIKTIVETGIKDGLEQHEIFDNVNKYIDILYDEQLIDDEYYKYIISCEKFSEEHSKLDGIKDIFLILIYEDKCSVAYEKNLKNKTKIYCGGYHAK